MKTMSTHEKCPECEKQRAILLTELFPEDLANENQEWTLPQLQQFKKHIANRKKSQESLANTTSGLSAQNKLTVGNSLLGQKMGDTGQVNTSDPSSPIGNKLFGKRVNEL
jgi:hypothetical protein